VSEDGLLAWDVRRLIDLSKDFAVESIDLTQITELDEPAWYSHEGDFIDCDPDDLPYDDCQCPAGRWLSQPWRINTRLGLAHVG